MHASDCFVAAEGNADVTVVVVTYNNRGDIGNLLDDLRRETDELGIRVVVVDNDSSDGTADLVAQHHDVMLVRSGANLGYGGGINVARRYVGECHAVLVLNPDLRVRTGAVKTLLAALDHQRVGVVVPRIVDDNGSTYPSLRTEPTVMTALGDSLFGHRVPGRGRRFAETVWKSVDYEYPHQVDWATGAALLIRAEVDQAVGDWSEAYFLYSEEVDYLRRVRDSGSLVWFEPDAVVEHRGAGSGSSPDLSTLMAVNRVRYFGSYHSELHTKSFHATVVLGELVRSYNSCHRATLWTLCHRERWRDLPKAQSVPVAPDGVTLGAIIIPAHNELAVIGRTLEPLAPAAGTGTFEVIVVCNGCTDDTADVARQYQGVTVVETTEASKPLALNLGDSMATAWPRLYLDADTTIASSAVEKVFATLRSGTLLAARPSSRFDVDGADAVVRSYYRARSRVAWFRTALWGAGAYALSAEGHRRIGSFPALTGDDLWVDSRFEPQEKGVVDTEPTNVVVPRDRHSLLHMLSRVYRGKAEVAEAPSAGRTLGAVIGAVRGPESVWDAGVYIAMTLTARKRSRGVTTAWARDESSRATPVKVQTSTAGAVSMRTVV